MLTDRCIHTLSFLFRRRAYDLAGGWDPAIKRNQEIDFHIRALLNGADFAYQPVITGLWRTHNEVRIANSTNLNDVVFFFQKMEKLITPIGLFTEELKKKIAFNYMWLVSQNINSSNLSLISAMREAVRLDPDIPFFKNMKVRFMSFLIGKDRAFTLWLNRFRKNRI
jgi:hypothetical protein